MIFKYLAKFLGILLVFNLEVSASETSQLEKLSHPRKFAASVGWGVELLDGSRSNLWKGGFTPLNAKLYYWVEKNIALDFGVFVSNHYYSDSKVDAGHVDVRMLHIGPSFRYYFEVPKLSPFLLAGIGTFSKFQTTEGQGKIDSETSFGFDLGAGVEINLVENLLSFQLEGRIHHVSFKDAYVKSFQPNLSGNFYTLTTGLLVSL